MPIPVTVPRLGWSMEEGVFAGWLVPDGATVRPGDRVFRLEGEKAVEEIESLDGGVLRIPADGPREGDRVAVGAVIGYLLQPGESSTPGPVEPAASPSVRRLARERGIDVRAVNGSGPGGRVTAGDVERAVTPVGPGSQPDDATASATGEDESGWRGEIIATGEANTPTPDLTFSLSGGRKPPECEPLGGLTPPAQNNKAPPAGTRSISPRARRLASRLGIDWTTLRGGGTTGRIREQDVAAAAGGKHAGEPGPAIPITPVRAAIAARTAESRRTTVPVTLTSAVDAENLVNLRGQFKAVAGGDGGPVPSYTDFLVKLAGFALQKHPLLTARWADDGIRPAARIDIGVAVDTEAGLLVPVVREVPAIGLRQLAATSRELVAKARAGRLTTREMEGGCFTVTNLGAYGIDAFTPVINLPECAILGVGRIERRPAVRGDVVVAREQVTLSLTFDHRIVDGAPAARFLQTLARMIENPGPWLSA